MAMKPVIETGWGTRMQFESAITGLGAWCEALQLMNSCSSNPGGCGGGGGPVDLGCNSYFSDPGGQEQAE